MAVCVPLADEIGKAMTQLLFLSFPQVTTPLLPALVANKASTDKQRFTFSSRPSP